MEHFKKEFHQKTWDEYRKNLTIVNEAEQIIIGNICKELDAEVIVDGTIEGIKEFDVILKYNINDKSTYEIFEIKVDYASSYTGNAFIEFIQNGYPSGIETTKADTMVIVSPSGTTEAHIVHYVDVNELKTLISTNTYKELNCGADKGGRARGYIIPIKDINNIAWHKQMVNISGNHFNPTSNNFYNKLKNGRK